MRAAPCLSAGRERERRPELREGVGELEPLRHHADDRVAVVVEGNLLADNPWVAAEASLPKPVAENDDARRALLVILFLNGAAMNRRDLKRREDAGRGGVADDVLGRVRPRQVVRVPVEGADLLEDRGLALQSSQWRDASLRARIALDVRVVSQTCEPAVL